MESLTATPTNILDAINNVITSDFSDFTGFIFKYNDASGYNTTLFEKVLGIPEKNIVNYDYDGFVVAARNALERKKEEVSGLISQIQSEQNIDENVRKYFVENLGKILQFLEITEKYYIPIEAWKIKKYITSRPSDEDLKKLLGDLKNAEGKIFGPEISKDLKNASVAYGQFSALLESPKTPLTEDERDFLESVKAQMKEYLSALGDEEISQGVGEIKATFELRDPLHEKRYEAILEKEIPSETLVDIFALALSICGIEGITPILNPQSKNIDVGKEFLNIPPGKTYKVRKIIGLIAHEIERHAIGTQNNKKFFGNFNSLSYLGQEEGLAHVIEHLALGYNLDEIPLNRYLFRMFAGEILSGEDFKKFLDISVKLDGETSLSSHVFFRRCKRGKDDSLPGVNPKEKLYGIGAIDVVQRLQNGENIFPLFLAKNGSSEQDMVTELFGKNAELNEYQEEGIVFPILLGELIRYKILADDTDASGLEKSGFIKYIEERYGTMFSSLGIDMHRFIENFISSQKSENRQKVRQILSLLQN